VSSVARKASIEADGFAAWLPGRPLKPANRASRISTGRCRGSPTSPAWRALAAGSADELRRAARRDECRCTAVGQLTGRGQRLAFIAQDDLPPGAAYEAHIASTGCVPTRHNLHDFFNASVWFAFPRIKAALNTRQSAAIDALGVGPTRGGVRDALTLFDENAVLFASADPTLSAALRAFDWQHLFVANRDAWGQRCEARCFGHALLEKLTTPFKACTAHAWIVEVPPAYFTWPDERRSTWLDESVSRALSGNEPLSSQAFAPLPVLGIPGWWPENEVPSFYDDVSVFRHGRRARSSDARIAPSNAKIVVAK
jgi:hypothetical protein